MYEGAPEVRTVGPLPNAAALRGHIIHIMAAFLSTGPEFERSENDGTRSCGGKQEWRVQLSLAAAVGS